MSSRRRSPTRPASVVRKGRNERQAGKQLDGKIKSQNAVLMIMGKRQRRGARLLLTKPTLGLRNSQQSLTALLQAKSEVRREPISSRSSNRTGRSTSIRAKQAQIEARTPSNPVQLHLPLSLYQ